MISKANLSGSNDDQKPGRRLSEIKKPNPKRLGFFMQRRMPERSEAGFGFLSRVRR
jgi:hypothetical protein